MRRAGALAAALVLGAVSGCAHTVVVSQSLTEMNQARGAPAVKDGASLAPQAFEHAEAERAEAGAAHVRGDEASADIFAERARVAYERAVVLARLARATTAGEAAAVALAKQTEDAQHIAAARSELERAADATATELAVAREARTPAHIGPADASRERARLVAAGSLAAQGHLLCGAGKLLTGTANAGARAGAAGSPDATDARLDAATHALDAVLASLAAHPPPSRGAAELEAAAKARAQCLDALTRIRRSPAGANAEDADALLSALSAHGGWDPSRDERGVVVTLRGAFKGTAVAAEAEQALRELGYVAASHTSYPVQVVVHDATAPAAADRAADDARGRAALSALGKVSAATSVETMGASLPTTDPSDARTRARNARLEIVFVSRAD